MEHGFQTNLQARKSRGTPASNCVSHPQEPAACPYRLAHPESQTLTSDTSTSNPPPPPPPEDPLARLEARLARIEALLERADHKVQEGQGVAATAVDTFDEAVGRLAAGGVDVDQRMRELGNLLERVTRPDVVEGLRGLTEMAVGLPGGIAAAADTMDELIARIAEAGIDVDARLRVVLQVAERLTAPAALEVAQEMLANIDSIRNLLHSGIFSEEAVHVVGMAARALGDPGVQRARPVGAFGALRAMGDPDTKHAIGVLLAIGRAFGRGMKAESITPTAGDQAR